MPTHPPHCLQPTITDRYTDYTYDYITCFHLTVNNLVKIKNSEKHLCYITRGLPVCSLVLECLTSTKVLFSDDTNTGFPGC